MIFEDVHNYYEKLVQQYLDINLLRTHKITDQNTLEDIACIALNRLPPRYVRHIVDTVFFLSTDEQLEIDRRVAEAVEAAVAIVQDSGTRQ